MPHLGYIKRSTTLALAAMIPKIQFLLQVCFVATETIIDQWKCRSSLSACAVCMSTNAPGPAASHSRIKKSIAEAGPSYVNMILLNRLEDHLTAPQKLMSIPLCTALTRRPSSSMYLNYPASIILRHEYISFVIYSGLIHSRCAQTYIIHLSCMLAQM